jgi:8-oxo-dGTP pyrophosphatase MutT (NUDIX family)
METGKEIAAGIIPIHPSTGKILMIRRGMDQSYPNMWSFFGGKFEIKDKTPKETAKREFSEESGIEHIKYYISSKPIYVNDNNHCRFYNFLGIFIEQFVPDLEKENEAQDYGWFSLDNLPHNMHPGAIELFKEKGNLISELIKFYSK